MKIEVETGKVYTFKLNSGEEVIAKVVDTDPYWVELSDPVSVAPGPQGMGLVPSMFTADITEKIRLNIKSISLYCITEDAVKMKYIEATTGIQVPDKKIIMG